VQTLADVREERYSFYWPTDELVSGLRFHRRATCVRVEAEAPACADSGRFARWNGLLVSFDPRIPGAELAEVLREASRLVPGMVLHVDREYFASGQRFAGTRRYGVVAILVRDAPDRRADRYRYTLTRRCEPTGNCRWVSSVGARTSYFLY
jgi:hypothetical protein